MVCDSRVFSLELPGFSIDIDVKREASIAFTHRFGAHSEDFVFAVAEIWVVVGKLRHLLVSDRHPGNMVELLKLFEVGLRNPNAAKKVELLFPQGRWGLWMRGYWERLMDDASLADDEATYEQLIPFSLVGGKGGHVVAYLYNGVPTIEVVVRPIPRYAWAEFDPECLARQVRELRESISAYVRRDPRKE